MLGFLFGTVCFLGLTRLVAGPRCHPRHGGNGWHGGPGWRGHHGHRGHSDEPGGFRRRGRRGGFGRAASEVFKRKLDLDEDQSDLADHALADLRAAMKEFGGAMKSGQADLAAAFQGEDVDDAGLAALFSTQDEEIARFRREAVSALKQIHAVLDDEQREEATRLLARAGSWK